MDAIEGTPERRQQLSQWMDEDRRLLRLRWSHVSQRADMSTQNIRDIRNGKIRITVDAADRLEDALEWERGSVERAILDGRRPTPRVADTEPTEPTVPEEARQMFAAIEQMFKSWGLEVTPRMLEVWHDEVARQLPLTTRQQASTTDRGRSDEDSHRSLDRGTGK